MGAESMKLCDERGSQEIAICQPDPASSIEQRRRDIEQCRREIAAIEALLLAGHPDLQGLCLALSDWWGELRMIEQEMRSIAAR
jgi:hypothetical protein